MMPMPPSCARAMARPLSVTVSIGLDRMGTLTQTLRLTRVRTLAADIGSRTSVMLTRILLAERYACEPSITPMRADLTAHDLLSDLEARLS